MSDDNTDAMGEFDAADAMLENLIGKDEAEKARSVGRVESPSDAPEDAPQGDTEEGAKDAQEGSEAPTEGTTEADPDDAEFELKIGEQTTKAKLRDLKAAYETREAASAERERASAAAQEAQAAAQRHSLGLNKMLEKAQARWEPYSKIDFLVLAQQVDAETLKVIRQDAQAALSDVQFLQTELDGARQAYQQESQQARQRASQEAIKVLSDEKSPLGIKGFGAAVYGAIIEDATRAYGTPKEALLGITDPWAIKALHDAMQWRQSQAKAAEVETKVTKAINKPTKLVTNAGRTPAAAPRDVERGSALSRQRDAGGDLDSTAEAILASLRG